MRALAEGESIFAPRIATGLLDFFAGRGEGRAREAFPQLTTREVEVLEVLWAGHPNPTIARRLLIAEKTASRRRPRSFAGRTCLTIQDHHLN